MFGSRSNPHVGPFHILSAAFMDAGFILFATAWPVLFEAQRAGRLATSGLYARIRHPQYVGFVLIMAGFLLQRPTLITLAMFPILVFMYVRLALREALADEYRRYMLRAPRFVPRLAGRPGRPQRKALAGDMKLSKGHQKWEISTNRLFWPKK